MRPGSGTPTGTVTFLDGSTVLGTGTLNGSGVATYTTGAFTLSVGSHSITAVYGADGNYSASTSGTLSETVNHDGHQYGAGLLRQPGLLRPGGDLHRHRQRQRPGQRHADAARSPSWTGPPCWAPGPSCCAAAT